MKVLILGNKRDWNLEQSYFNALEASGHQVDLFDLTVPLNKYIKFGRFGRTLNQFLPVDTWIKKANRDLVIHVQKTKPDVLFVFCNAKVSYGALAYIKSVCKVKIVLIWPDTLLNIQQDAVNNVPFYDMVASYSETSADAFRMMGYKNVHWIPLAGDEVMFGVDIPIQDDLRSDICFLGGCRPEREAALAEIVKHFPDRKIKIYGVDWIRHCKNRSLLKYHDKRLFYGREFAKVIKASTVNLNIIDDTNYPAANMRFFEIPMSGGLQISSDCPEMKSIFKHGESVLYHSSHTEMIENIQSVLQNREQADRIRAKGYELVKQGHTYTRRVEQIMQNI